MATVSCTFFFLMTAFYSRLRKFVNKISYICPKLFIKFGVNGIFSAIFLLSAGIFLLVDPEGFLPAMLSGAEKAGTLSLALLAVYCVWLGFFEVMEQSGLSEKLSRLFFPLAKKLFRSDDKKALTLACGNLSANLLGLPGAPTPLGIQANAAFLQSGNSFASDTLFVLNATSLQLLPTTVIALRSSLGSANPADILLPTLIATLFSSCLGVLLVRLFHRKSPHCPNVRKNGGTDPRRPFRTQKRKERAQ